MATGTDDSDRAAIWGDLVDLDDECEVEDASEPPGPSAEREYAAQNMIASVVQDTSRLLLYRETFLLPAPTTQHRILFFPLLGPSLRTHVSSMSVAARMSSAKQLLQAIKVLHDDGVVHRDINCSNVLYGLTPFKSGTDLVTKYEYLGHPKKINIPTYKPLWKEGELVMPCHTTRHYRRRQVFIRGTLPYC